MNPFEARICVEKRLNRKITDNDFWSMYYIWNEYSGEPFEKFVEDDVIKALKAGMEKLEDV